MTTVTANNKTATRKPSTKKRKRKNASASREDVYTRVTNQIVAKLEQGVRPWHQPWSVEYTAGRIMRPLRANGIPYQGINILMLWAEAEEKTFACPYWLTFKQAKDLGGIVNKGEKSSQVVYANKFTKVEQDQESGEEVSQEIPYLKQYNVFNAEQCEGLPVRFSELQERPEAEIERNQRADSFFTATNADIREGGNRAFYSVTHDYVQLPPLPTFRDVESHSATLCHEMCHWTRHSSRLDRDLGRKRWGDAGYAMEELVAELGAAFLCADLGITPEVRDDHAAYIETWLKALKEDKRAIFTAASHASKAVDYLHGLQATPERETDSDE